MFRPWYVSRMNAPIKPVDTSTLEGYVAQAASLIVSRRAETAEDWRLLFIWLLGFSSGHVLRLRAMLKQGRLNDPAAIEAALDELQVELEQIRKAHL